MPISIFFSYLETKKTFAFRSDLGRIFKLFKLNVEGGLAKDLNNAIETAITRNNALSPADESTIRALLKKDQEK
jgi:hypothetical protein